MKPTFRTFSLRTVLILVTVLAAVLAFVGNKLIESRRQERLLNEAQTLLLYDIGNGDDASFLIWTAPAGERGVQVIGGLLSERTAKALVRAERIVEVTSETPPSPAVEKILLEGFKRGGPQDGLLVWIR